MIDQGSDKTKEYASLNYFTAPDARALIVDDMPINLKVTANLISPLMIKTDFASNGQEALEKIYSESYDIVFMDHMMPVMDGVAAVTELRSGKEIAYRELPIIALTSNASDEAKELFSKSGFSGFLSKPIDFQEICYYIKTWLPAEKIKETDIPLMEYTNHTSEPAYEKTMNISIPGVDPATGIKNSGDPVYFTELLSDIYRIMDEKCSVIEGAIAGGDITRFTTEVHALKTSCRMIGAMKLSEAFYSLEKLGNDNNLEKITECTPSVLEDFRAMKPFMKPYAESLPTPEKIYDKETVLELLNRLLSAINDFELSDAEKITRELLSFQYDDELRPMIEKLEKLIFDLDYDEAAEHIEAIIKMN